VENLIIQGHMIVIPAEPNGGKTTIFWSLSKEISNDGYQVFYVNADIAGGDAKAMIGEAENSGVTLMLPDMKVGLSMEDVIAQLSAMNERDGDYSNYVFIFDTLKKMTDVISKGASKQLYKLLRGLTAKGMTIILLAHTNKYKGEDGLPIYEGTGDLRSDVDEMIYLVPVKNQDGSLTVSTIPDKVRGTFEPISFHISKDRAVTIESDYVDTLEERRAMANFEKDEPVIDAITDAIQNKRVKQIEIIDYCREKHGVVKTTTQKVLKRYRDPSGYKQLWNERRGYQNNAYFYELCSPFVTGSRDN
jgi:hypothetical protein